MKAKIALKRIVAAIGHKRIIADIKLGLFQLVRLFSDVATATEAKVLAFVKSLSESPIASDTTSLDVTKAESDTYTASDSNIIQFGKVEADSFSTSDQIDTLGIGKGLSETPVLTEAQVFDITKLLTDNIGVTDDFDGIAVPDDDQTIQFVKVLTESSSTSDSDVKLIGKVHSDSASSSDSGSLLNQGYVDNPYYFADDYVGAKRTF